MMEVLLAAGKHPEATGAVGIHAPVEADNRKDSEDPSQEDIWRNRHDTKSSHAGDNPEKIECGQ